LIKEHTHTNTKPIRVFFAIFPDKSVQAQLTHQAEQLKPICGGNTVKMQQIHLTLLFLGNIAIHRLEILQQAMKNVAAKKFEFKLEEICYWKHNQIVYCQAKQFPAALFTLADSLKNAVSDAGFLIDTRTYKPHVTLIRKATHSKKINLDTPVIWHVSEWFLIQSKQTDRGVEYIPLSQWHLR